MWRKRVAGLPAGQDKARPFPLPDLDDHTQGGDPIGVLLGCARPDGALAHRLRIAAPGKGAQVEDPVDFTVADGVDQVQRALALFRERDVEAVIACQITWGEDRLILKAVEELPNVPLLLWCYTPYTRLPEQMSMRDLFRASGPVGALQASGPLKRLGIAFGSVFGSYQTQATIDRIVAWSRAAQSCGPALPGAIFTQF